MKIRCLAPDKFPLGGTVSVVRLDDPDFGPVQLGWHADALCLCMLGRIGEASLQQRLRNWAVTEIPGTAALERASRAALDAFKNNTAAALPPLLLAGTDFQQAVWRLLLGIPFGTTTTYMAISRHLKTGSFRSVGTAIGKNPVSLFVPCHRVIASSGKPGGYAWGLPLKEKLLAFEAARAKPRRK